MTTPAEIAFVNRFDKVASSFRTAYDRYVLMIIHRLCTFVGAYEGDLLIDGRISAANDDRRMRPCP